MASVKSRNGRAPSETGVRVGTEVGVTRDGGEVEGL